MGPPQKVTEEDAAVLRECVGLFSSDPESGAAQGDCEAERADGFAQDKRPSPAALPIDEGVFVGGGPVEDLDRWRNNLSHGESKGNGSAEALGDWDTGADLCRRCGFARGLIRLGRGSADIEGRRGRERITVLRGGWCEHHEFRAGGIASGKNADDGQGLELEHERASFAEEDVGRRRECEGGRECGRVRKEVGQERGEAMPGSDSLVEVGIWRAVSEKSDAHWPTCFSMYGMARRRVCVGWLGGES